MVGRTRSYVCSGHPRFSIKDNEKKRKKNEMKRAGFLFES